MQPSLIFLGCLAASIVYCDLFHRMSRNVNQMSKDTFTFLFIMIYIPEKRSFIIEMMTMSCTIMGFLIDEVKFQVWHDECAVSSYDSIYICAVWQHVQYCMCSDIIWHVVCAMEAVFPTSDSTVANNGCNSFRISLNFHKTSIQHKKYSLVVGTNWIPAQVSELDTC